MTNLEERTDHLLSVEGLKTHFFSRSGVVKAVDGITYDVREGETLAIVGESGCGKSVGALSIMRLVSSPPGRIVDGRVVFDGEDLLAISESSMRRIRGNRIAMIFPGADDVAEPGVDHWPPDY